MTVLIIPRRAYAPKRKPTGNTANLKYVRKCRSAKDYGRLFGCCGEGICRFFVYDPAVGEVADIGCAVSVLERRRYGYQFAEAVVGRDGQVYFGEDDALGHLWIYFPSIGPRR